MSQDPTPPPKKQSAAEYYQEESRRRMEECRGVFLREGVKGAAIYSVITAAAVFAAHRSWPLFQKQTLAFKVFIVSGGATCGMMIEGENAAHDCTKSQPPLRGHNKRD
eukprot:TRINITY_DN3677_c0_g1_i1.p1 TRINITY_DN3677_c0_g1~~TRINITY_DN3677_c0_g1_i1.p1  ORF type:complete len:108 (-),score=27.91 TRINITY_DN3677_c0_g1_i1:99-422(-)